MSYEGYSQYWCKNGHYWTVDIYFMMYDNEQKCPICNEKSVFENTVNLTNGSFDEDDNRIDGYIEPELIDKSELKCKCGKVHICECSIYKIPEYKNE